MRRRVRYVQSPERNKERSLSDVVLELELVVVSQPITGCRDKAVKSLFAEAGFRRRRGQKNRPRVCRSVCFRQLLSCRGLCLFCCSFSASGACPACVGRLFPAPLDSLLSSRISSSSHLFHAPLRSPRILYCFFPV